MLASDQVSTVSRILSSLSDHDIDKLIDKHIDDMMSETQSSSGSKMLRRKI